MTAVGQTQSFDDVSSDVRFAQKPTRLVCLTAKTAPSEDVGFLPCPLVLATGIRAFAMPCVQLTNLSMKSFVGDGVRPVLRRKIKSNRIGCASAFGLNGHGLKGQNTTCRAPPIGGIGAAAITPFRTIQVYPMDLPAAPVAG
jgi:hypothetical protein